MSATAVLTACGGGQVGGQTGGEDAKREVHLPGPGPMNSVCRHEAPRELATLDEAPAGLSAREVLSMAVADEPLAITWNAVDPLDGNMREIHPTPDAEPDPTSLSVAYADGPVWYLGPGDCQRIDVEVEVSLRSDSGALDERATAWLSAFRLTRDGEVRIMDARIEFILEPQGVALVGWIGGGPDEGGPPPRVAAQGGTLDVEATLMYPPPGAGPDPELDPDFSERLLSQRGWLVAIPIVIVFEEDRIWGVVDAWLQGTRTGGLSRASEIGTLDTLGRTEE